MDIVKTRPEGGFSLSGRSRESLEMQTAKSFHATASDDAVLLHMVCGKIASGKSTLVAPAATEGLNIVAYDEAGSVRLSS
ncbi:MULTISPECIES: hypothetical protein [Burkholderia]|jgi:polynucleotide 5'-kinase involved in rRNA processing|uniref:Uncharacterized protein n=1 Tax=Burkholderia contaminans TaxID=488447 RepID=A0A250LHS0_9BURK|nr:MULTISPECIES: hypothetical protein [Burkholderia]UTP27372.1 hypothetical protein NMB33_34775 [Burkholderia sp. FXe9]MBH9691525.1 hypothetical protein [Burkholderia contaminans]MBK1902995.1 hypothetical protein [Burkholderia contaminans]MBK1910880.1 hypothetical protein [Burkholderia contaminans]MBK1927499.1 hypothetical protein [Burkholderia contaminans]